VEHDERAGWGLALKADFAAGWKDGQTIGILRFSAADGRQTD
jgi:hypothetical protein